MFKQITIIAKNQLITTEDSICTHRHMCTHSFTHAHIWGRTHTHSHKRDRERERAACLCTRTVVKHFSNSGSAVLLLWYRAILHSRADSLCLHVILREWLAFCSAFLNVHRSGVLTVLAWLVPRETAAVLASSVYTIQPCTMSLHAKPHT